MQKGPKIRLAVDLHRFEKYFPLDYGIREGFDFELIINRHRYDEAAHLLGRYHITDDRITQELCFIVLWIEKEIAIAYNQDTLSGEYHQIWIELDDLKQYLLNHRITAITFRGEYEKNKTGEDITLRTDMNIDRICDGIRTIFRDEFSNDKKKRVKKGLKNWKRRKMVLVKNNILNYFTSVPELDKLTLEEQNTIITKLADMAGLPG